MIVVLDRDIIFSGYIFVMPKNTSFININMVSICQLCKYHITYFVEVSYASTFYLESYII